MGYLPGDNGGTASGISGDGSTVVGATTTGGILPIAYTWQEETGIVGLGDFSGGVNSSSSAATSFDGSVVVGTGNSGSSTAFRWTLETGLVSLGTDSAQDVSADGNTIVGRDGVGGSQRAYIWTPQTGALHLGTLPGGGVTQASGVSADGLIVVGSSGGEAFRWSASTGMFGLGNLTGNSFDDSSAIDISADGTVIVGDADISSSVEHAFVWTLSEGMVGLGSLGGDGFSSSAVGVSGDGSIIVGTSETPDGSRAFIWTEDSGMLDLQGLLLERGFDLSQWQTLTSATGISDDGSFISGRGINANGLFEGYRIRFNTIPEPSSGVTVLLLSTAFLVRRRR